MQMNIMSNNVRKQPDILQCRHIHPAMRTNTIKRKSQGANVSTYIFNVCGYVTNLNNERTGIVNNMPQALFKSESKIVNEQSTP